MICVIIDYIKVESAEYREVSPPYLTFLSFLPALGSESSAVALLQMSVYKKRPRLYGQQMIKYYLSSISNPRGTPAAKIATRQNNEVRSSFFQTTYFIKMKSESTSI